MLTRRGVSPDPCETAALRRGNLLIFPPLAVVRVKLQLPSSSMIKRTMSGSNRNNLQVQDALTVMSDVIKGLFGS